ncbi:MAG: SemiSWEET family sugar transporter [Saprospiraceae bacterium]
MDGVLILGIIAGTLTTAMVVPQLIKTLKTKEVEDIALGTFITASIGVALWLTYGIHKNDVALIITNSVSLLLNITMIVIKLRYQHRSQAAEG